MAIKNAIPRKWVNTLQSEKSVKTKVKTHQNCTFLGENIMKLETKDIYKRIQNISRETPIGFLKWKREFNSPNIMDNIRQMLIFISDNLRENKLKIFRWKILHFILPNKKLLYQWKITDTQLCNFCNVEENYSHFFIECKFLEPYWKDIKSLLEHFRIGSHIISLKNLVLGYKIKDKEYNEINYLLTLILYAVYKAYYVSSQKQHYVNVYNIFKKEFKMRYELKIKREKTSCFIFKLSYIKWANSITLLRHKNPLFPFTDC